MNLYKELSTEMIDLVRTVPVQKSVNNSITKTQWYWLEISSKPSQHHRKFVQTGMFLTNLLNSTLGKVYSFLTRLQGHLSASDCSTAIVVECRDFFSNTTL